MDRNTLLKTIAETGYNVGFGAKKHFATFDIVQKAPGIISFLGIAAGIFGLVFDQLAAKLPAATLAVLGVIGLYISLRDSRKADYEAAGKTLTRLYNRLRDLSRNVDCGADVDQSLAELHAIENEYYAASISEQVILSDWYAHYKFFAQQQIDWIEKHKTFTLRDKIPLSIRLMGVVLLSCVIVSLIYFAWAKRQFLGV